MTNRVARARLLPRSAGILLHPTSLPGPHGIGELGGEAIRFVDLLVQAGLTVWQMLPLGPTGYGNSPYQCFSAFAGNPLLIDAGTGAEFADGPVDFARVIPFKQALVRRATGRFLPDADYHAFVTREAWWLEDYALFMALKAAHGGAAWTDWDPAVAHREQAGLAAWSARLSEEIEHFRREQAIFAHQFRELKQACGDRGVRLMGDVPIYVAHDSADVWANRALFKLDDNGRPTVQAGVPPDYFSATGQLWGNPIYDWDAHRTQGFEWWIRRLRAAFEQFDLVRLDHFRGFEAYWEIPGDAPTAATGRWVPGPGVELFDALERALGRLPIVAENLGVITPEVEALRSRYGFPGMSVLQFAFSGGPRPNPFLPHNHTRETVVYTGTHDNDTTRGWWESGGGGSTRSDQAVAEEQAFARQYLATDGREIHWALIRAALGSVADTAIIPLQDLLGLGSEARMNLPGRETGNWSFRFSFEQITPEIVARMRALVEMYDRQRSLPTAGSCLHAAN